MRQGRLNVATWVIVNGRLGSGACSPALICACAVADANVSMQCRIQKSLHVSTSSQEYTRPQQRQKSVYTFRTKHSVPLIDVEWHGLCSRRSDRVQH